MSRRRRPPAAASLVSVLEWVRDAGIILGATALLSALFVGGFTLLGAALPVLFVAAIAAAILRARRWRKHTGEWSEHTSSPPRS